MFESLEIDDYKRVWTTFGLDRRGVNTIKRLKNESVVWIV